MAQGQLKRNSLRKPTAAPSKAVNRRPNKPTIVKKGKRTIAPKARNNNNPKTIAHQAETNVTKAIIRKNEAIIAAKAVSVGSKFFLSDIAGKGKKELDQQLQQRDKKQNKTNQIRRHVDALQKL